MVGAGKITGAARRQLGPAVCPVPRPGKLSGPGGTIIFKVKPGSAAAETSGPLFSVSGKATVLKATGKLAKRNGTLKMTGTYDRRLRRLHGQVQRSLTAWPHAHP